VPNRDDPHPDPEHDRADITEDFDVIQPDLGDEPTAAESIAATRSGGLSRIIPQGLIGASVLVVLIVNPGDLLGLEEVAAFVLVLIGLSELASVVRTRAGTPKYIAPLVALSAGVVVWVWPEETRRVVGLVIGAVLILRGLVDLFAAIRRWHERGANTWVAVRGLILVAAGAQTLLVPVAAVPTVVVGGAMILIARAVIGVTFAVSPNNAPDAINPTDTYSVLAYWLSKRHMTDDEIEYIEETVFLHRGNTRDRITRFGVLMGLATSIATFGIAVDSTAVVIGAMLVAPLMTPILGVSAGLIRGRTRSTLVSTAVVLGGSIGSIILAWLLSALIPNLAEVIDNAQVVTRTAPTLLDLAIAVAAGAAGAYGVSRSDSSDALPGVAVAIALVPPLAVVGITLHAGDLHQAAGATLLFLTNLFSIILMAGIVFLVVGYGSWSRLHYRRNRIRTAFSIVVLGVVLISIPLALTAQTIVGTANDQRNASSAVNAWLDDEFGDEDPTPLRVNELTVDHDLVVVQLVGWEEPPPSDELQQMLTDAMGRPMIASVRWIEEQLERSE
jgi:uncharacterized hydrophobic protein (TIGR00271 family)